MKPGGTPPSGRTRSVANQPTRQNYPSLGSPSLGRYMTSSASAPLCQIRPQKAASVVSMRYSAAARISENDLDVMQRIADLEEEREQSEERFHSLENDLIRKEQQLAYFKSKAANPAIAAEISKLEFDILNTKSDIRDSERKLASLQRSYLRRKAIIEKERDHQNILIRDEGDANLDDVESDENEEEGQGNENVTSWLQQEQPDQGQLKSPTSRPTSPTLKVNRVTQKNENVSMTDLISALQNLVPAQQEPIYNNKDLPFFDGKPEDWLIFKSEYERTERKHQPSQNIIRLRQHLKGAAAAAVGHLLDNPNNIPTILETLKELFGNPKHIIKYLIEKVKAAKPPDVNKPASVVEFVTAVDSLVTNILSYGLKEYVNNMQLLDELVDKLPTTLKWDWVKFKRDSNESECLKTFQTWMKGVRSLACEFYTPSFTESKKSPEPRRRRPQGVHAAKEAPICNYCDMKYHRIDVCRRFAELTHEEKIEAIKEKELCFKCLEKGHHAPRCDKVCSVDSCQGPHHKLIHLPRKDGKKGFKKSISQKSPSPSPTTPEVPSANLAVASGGDMCLIPVQVTGPKGNETVLALLDTGSSLTMLEEDVAKKIGLKGVVKPLSFNVFGKDVRANPKSMIVSVSVKGVQRGSSTFTIDNARTVDSLGIPASPLNIKKMKEKHPYLECVRAKSIGNQKPKMIIGADNHRLFRPSHAIEDPEEKGPSGNLCKLGWYISDVTGGSSCYFACQSCNKEDDADLHQSMKEFFAIEEKGMKAQINPARSKEDQRAFKLLEENTKQVSDRWETCLLWKEDNLELPSSKHMALNRLKLMEKKMDRDSDFAKLSCDKFSDYIEKGFLVPVEKSVSGIDSSKRKWYLPWFFAYHPTKKPRLVFDAAAKAGGKSLNDYLLKGPDLINSLPDVLMRFRSHPIAVTGDIKEMFHQVRLRAEDWPSQTILYRGMDRSQPPKEYYMTVLFFGAASSPCSTIIRSWLRREAGRFKVFIQTKTGDMFELTNPKMWKWVRTKLNVADDATRAKRNEDLSSSCRRLIGEDSLLLEESKWLKENKLAASEMDRDDPEMRKAAFAALPSRQQWAVEDISSTSSLLKLIGSTGTLFLVSRSIRNRAAPKNILVEHMSTEEKLWIKQSQLDYYLEEENTLKISKEGVTDDLPESSRLAFLFLALSYNRLIVFGGRINATPRIFEMEKQPPILEPAHSYRKMSLKCLHEGKQHQGQEAVKNWSDEQPCSAVTAKRNQWNAIPLVSPQMGGSQGWLIRMERKVETLKLSGEAPRIQHLKNPTQRGLVDRKNKFQSTWRKRQRAANEFQRRTKKCPTTMAPRSTWRDKYEPAKGGDVIIWKDNQFPRRIWKLRIIMKVYSEEGGLGWIVDVREVNMRPGESKTPGRIKACPSVKMKVVPIGKKFVLVQHWEGGNVPVRSNEMN